MDEDSSIRVLHFQNPHLMWIELKKQDTFSLRQVGVFGVVPRQSSTVDGERVCTKSDHWDPRANDIVEEFLETKHLLSFKSTYRLEEDDSPTSIFSNQPHIFGEIIIRKQDGVKKQLATCLDNSVYAYRCKDEFWQMLMQGKITTVLSDDEAIDVLLKIRQNYQNRGSWQKKRRVFYQHLSPAQAAKLQETDETQTLTEENLEKHLNLTNQQQQMKAKEPMTPKKTYKKYQDFNANGQALGPVEFVEDMIRKHTVVENAEDLGYCKEVNAQEINGRGALSQVSTITVYNEEVNEDLNHDEYHVAIGRANTRKKDHATEETGKIEELIKLKERCRLSARKLSSESDRTQNANQKLVNKECLDKNVSSNEAQIRSYESLDCSQEIDKTSGSSSEKYAERMVAIGPPMDKLETLVKKRVLKLNYKLAAKQDHENARTGNVNWEDDGEIKDNNDSRIHKSYTTDVNENYEFRNANQSESKNVNNSGDTSNFQERDSKNVPKTNGYLLKRRQKCDLDVFKTNNDFVQNNNGGFNGDVNLTLSNQNNIITVQDTKQKTNGENNGKSVTKKSCSFTNKRKSRGNHRSPTSSASTVSQSANLNDSDFDELEEIHAQLNYDEKPLNKQITASKADNKDDIHVNPYKNFDDSKSVFVQDLIHPLILAHSKNDNKILPQSSLKDIPFKFDIHNILRNKKIQAPTRLQSVTWPYILRGHSVFMVSPAGSGKTLGYLPAICNLVLDYNFDLKGLGPKCIIVCATSLSVTFVERECRLFLRHHKVLSGFSGVDPKKLVIELTNGCDIFVATPSMLYRLLKVEIGVDLRRLTTLVFEDCEGLDNVYELEIKAIQLYVMKMLKSRTDKQVKVQYVLASRRWCDFMNSLAKKAPDTVVTFTAFHECVLYSKTNTSVSFVKKCKKNDVVIEFLNETDDSKLTVIVCRSDDEVELLKSILTGLNYNVVACNNKMTIHDLYKIRTQDLGSILICCDGNLSYLNVTHAHYLVQYSMPASYTHFCARFAVLNDNYPSIFGDVKNDVKIKILLEETNVDELPKILKFVKRCSSQVPEVLNEVAKKALEQKDLSKAERLVPICDILLSLGECADIHNCQERHAILNGYDDTPSWLPRNGTVTFKVIHYNSAISYSARLLTHTINDNREKYPETYGILCMKLGMFFSKERNKRLHGEPKNGDICAIAVRKNFMARCQVLKILNYEKKHVNQVVVNLIDEEKIQVVKAVELIYLPDEFKSVKTYVVKVRLAAIRPLDKDVTFSEVALKDLKRITDGDDQLYLKGRVVMAIGKTIFVETLEACADLSALSETVVKYDFKKLLLEKHATPNPDHLSKIQKLCKAGKLNVTNEPEVIITKPQMVKREVEHRWAHLNQNDWTEVLYSSTENAGKFFIRPHKFNKCVKSLISDIKKYVDGNPEQLDKVCVKDIVLAEFPDDAVYERAIIEEIIDDSKVKCFFVDNADWRDVAVSKLKQIPMKFIKQIPFQSIECKLLGIKPHNEEWTEFSTNWLHDNCLEDERGRPKIMYAKYYTKEKAEVTGGHKYGVVLVDTSTDVDLVINKRMIELNLTAVNEDEYEYLEKSLDFVREKTDCSSTDDDIEFEKKNLDEERTSQPIPIPIKLMSNDDEMWNSDDNVETIEELPRVTSKNLFSEKPIRSFPLVSDSDDDSDKWDICIDEDLGKCFGLNLTQSSNENNKNDEITKVKEPTMQDMLKKKDNATSAPIKPKIPAITDGNNEGNTNTKLKNEIAAKDVVKKLNETTLKAEDTGLNEIGLNEHNETDVGTENIKEFNITKKEDMNVVIKEMAKKATEVLNNSQLHEPNVTVYDSDDDLSIICDKIEQTNIKSLNKNETSILDSDDTQSFVTECDKSKNIITPLDSDDSDTEYVDKPKSVSVDIKSINVLNKNNLSENDFVNSLINNQITFKNVGEKSTKLKKISITETNKDAIATKAENGSEVETKKFEIGTIIQDSKNPTINIDHITVNDDKVNIVKLKTLTKDIETDINISKDTSNIITVESKDEHKLLDENKSKTEPNSETITEGIEATSTPQLIWRQDKTNITIKIKVIVDKYTVTAENRSLKFSAYQNETKYAFDIKLYGVIEPEKTTHTNKGLYIQVNLVTLLKKSIWLKLTKDIKSWIVYDTDNIYISSDDEELCKDDALKGILERYEKAMEIGDDDDDIDDTSGYRYRDDD